MTTIRWLDAEFDRPLLARIVSAMEKDEYRPPRASGFQLSERRTDRATGWFHEKLHIVESVTDPFGNVSETSRVQFRRLEFRLTTAWPSVEIRDAARAYGEFVTNLAHYAEHAVRIAPLRIDVQAWIEALEESVDDLAVLSMDFAHVGISQDATAKLSIESQRDVRKASKKFLGDRDARLVRSTVQWQPSPAVTALCELRESGSARLHEGPKGTADLLRASLLRGLGR